MEKSFLLDGVCVSNLTNKEVYRCSPQHDISIPSYNPTTDKHCSKYFRFCSLPKLVTSRVSSGRNLPTVHGAVRDKLLERCSSAKYVNERNKTGAGCEWDNYRGHNTEVYKPILGWNGAAGYRRNTFKLRYQPSSFEPPLQKRLGMYLEYDGLLLQRPGKVRPVSGKWSRFPSNV